MFLETLKLNSDGTIDELTVDIVKENMTIILENDNNFIAKYPDTVVAKEYLDMHIITSAAINFVDEVGAEGKARVSVTKELCDILGMTEDEMLKYAISNTKNHLNFTFESLRNKVKGQLHSFSESLTEEEIRTLSIETGIHPEVIKEEAIKFEKDMDDVRKNFYVLSNDDNFYGSTMMLFEEVMTDITNQLNDDVYLLPMSVHETIIIEKSIVDDKLDFSKLRSYVDSVTSDKDFNRYLSNTIYVYDRNSKQISIVDE